MSARREPFSLAAHVRRDLERTFCRYGVEPSSPSPLALYREWRAGSRLGLALGAIAGFFVGWLFGAWWSALP